MSKAGLAKLRVKERAFAKRYREVHGERYDPRTPLRWRYLRKLHPRMTIMARGTRP